MLSRISITLLAAAQPSRPVVPRMKPQTMSWSLRLSRWKHIAKASFSSASLQMGRFRDRQKARVHWVQEEEAARSRSERRECWAAAASFMVVVPGEEEVVWGPSWIRVLFLKQVHLQKVGTAEMN